MFEINRRDYKVIFFHDLMQDVRDKGFNAATLNKKFKSADMGKLFNNWKGHKGYCKSAAALCLHSLYQLLHGNNDLISDVSSMVMNREGFTQNFTEVEVLDDVTESMLNAILVAVNAKLKNRDKTEATFDDVKRAWRNPSTARKSDMGKVISHEIERVKSWAAVLQRDKAQGIRRAEAIYQRHLIGKAFDKIDENIDDLCFDPQGHVIVDVELNKYDYQKILDKLSITAQLSREVNYYKNILEEHLGLTPGTLTKTTLCNIDVIKGKEPKTELEEKLEERFKEWVCEGSKRNEVIRGKMKGFILDAAFERLLKDPHRGSVNALGEVAEMHIRMVSRVIKELDNENKLDVKWKGIIAETSCRINEVVRRNFQDALAEAYDPNTELIDYARLNYCIDSTIVDLNTICKEKFMEVCANKKFGIGEEFSGSMEK